MTNDGNKNQKQVMPAQSGVVTKIDALYSWLSYDLQRMQKELSNELKYSAMQSSSQFKAMKEEAAASAGENAKTIQSMAIEMKFAYKQNQAIYDALSAILTDEVIAKLDSVEGKLELLESIETALTALNAKFDAFDVDEFASIVRDRVVEGIPHAEEIDYDKITDSVAEKTEASVSEHSRQVLEAIAAIPVAENVDYSRIVEEVGDRMLELLQETNAVAAATEEEILVEAPEIDYDRIIYGAAEKVVESLPYPEKVDYKRIDENFAAAAAEIKQPDLVVDTDSIVERILAAIDVNAIAEAVAAKIEVPAAPEVDYDKLSDMIVAKLPAPEAIDYDKLADAVIAKLPEVKETESVDYDKIATVVAEKMAASEDTCDVMLDEDGVKEIAAVVAETLDVDTIAAKVAEKLPAAEQIDYERVYQAAKEAQVQPEGVDYVRIGEIVEEKLGTDDEDAYDVVIDEEGIRMIAEGVAEILREELVVAPCEVCEKTEEYVQEEIAVEEATEEVVEETPVEEKQEEVVEAVEEPEQPAQEDVVEETQETVAEEVAEEKTEEVVVEETPVHTETKEEIAVAVAEMTEGAEYNEIDNQLVDAETGLVIRLKRSFVAKMKQSESDVKEYYAKLKNEFDSYKRLNSNVSWHGDRFNYGRDTVAKMNICGKTLCLYLALDPNDPEIKTTVYHQKDVGSQKAYESTPLMVKIKSGAAVKKATRLVAMLAEKLNAEKDEQHKEVDYVEEFAYETTKALLGQGLIKITKEKKVDLDF